MEMKTYRRYTKPVTEQDLWDFCDMKPKTISGKATYISSRDGYLSMKFNDKRWYIKHDDVTKKAAEYLKGCDQIEVTYWYDRYKEKMHIISFINHTKNTTVINQKLTTIMRQKQETEARRNRHHNILREVMARGRHVFVMAKKVKDDDYQYELVGVRNEYQDGMDSRTNINILFDKIGLVSADDVLEKTDTLVGYFNQVYGHEDYVFGIFRTTEKNKTCSYCGNHAWSEDGRNHSIVVGGGSFDETYYCEYCFFDKMHIQVPEKFFNEERASA